MCTGVLCVQALVFGTQGHLEHRVYDFTAQGSEHTRLRVHGLRFKAYGSRIRVHGLRCTIYGLGLGFRVQLSGCRM
jgi:hypothetical protein